jgi:hypothetical protein
VAFALNKTSPHQQLGPPSWMVDQCREAAEEMHRSDQQFLPVSEPVDLAADAWGDAAGGCSWRDLV